MPKTVAESVPAEPKSQTNWAAFMEAGLVPREIRCDGYQEFHAVNLGCHTVIQPKVDVIKAHIANDHGGGFVVRLTTKHRGKMWSGWNDLAAAGIEAQDFRCGVCQQEIPLQPQQLLKHSRSHINGNRKFEHGGEFRMTLLTPFTAPAEDPSELEFIDDPDVN